MAKVSSSNTTTLYSTTQTTPIKQGAPVTTGKVNDSNFTTLYSNPLTESSATVRSAGDVVGPSSSTDNAAARWDGTTGKLLQNSALIIADTTGNITINANQTNNTSSVTFSGYGQSSYIDWSALPALGTPVFRMSDQLQIFAKTIATSTTDTTLLLNLNSTGTPTAGFGGSISLYLEDRSAGLIQYDSVDLTPGSEKYRLQLSAIDKTIPYTNTGLIIDSVGSISAGGNNLTINYDESSVNSSITAYKGSTPSNLTWDGTNWTFDNQFGLANNNTSTPKGVQGTVAGSDYWFVGGYSIGGAGANDGAMVIATGNNGIEPIYVRQYTGSSTTQPFPGGNTIARELTLLDANGNTTLPGTLSLKGSTSGTITLSAGTTPSAQTYTLPTNYPASNGYVLSSTTGGVLSWVSNPSPTGDVVGPSSSTDNAAARFDGTTGKLIQNSALLIADTTGNITINAGQTVNDSVITMYNSTNSGTITYTEITTNNNSFDISDRTRITETTASSLSTSIPVLDITAINTSGVPTVGYGPQLTFNSEYPGISSGTVGLIRMRMTDATIGSIDYAMDIGLIKNGSQDTQVMTVDSQGNVSVDGDLTINSDQTAGNAVINAYSGSTQGSLTWNGSTWDTNPINIIPVNNTATSTGIGGTVANATSSPDFWHIGGYSIGGAGANDGALEIAVANNGDEPIYVRQYNGGVNTGTTWPYGNSVLRTLTLLDASGNTTLPGDLAVNGGDITTTQTTASLFNTTATTVNIGGVGTTVNVGNVASPGSSIVKVPTLQLYNNLSQIDGGQITTTSTSPFAICSTARQSMKVIVNIIDNVTTEVHSIEAFAMKKGTNGYLTTYAELYSAAALATFSVDVSGGSVRLLVTPLSTNNTTTTVIKQSLA